MTQDLLAERRSKLAKLQRAGIDCYPSSFADRTPIANLKVTHEDLADGDDAGASYRVAGRLVGRRGHGKAAFMDLLDRSGKLQLHARADLLGEASFEQLAGLDLGDLIGVEGSAFKTRRGELSLKVTEWQLLAKSLRPPPEKFHGLEDVETRYRQRELDLIANEEVRKVFTLRTRVVAAVRRFLDERGFLEVETPVLQPLYGGALARPFVTHHNALDRDLYLRIATELYLKRLIVGGLEKVYELGKDFRNEGVSYKHNPEFTMLETYEAYVDYLAVAETVEELVSYVAREVLGTTVVTHKDREVDLKPPWRRVSLRNAIVERTGIDFLEHGDSEALAAQMAECGYRVPEGAGYGKLVDELLSKCVEPELIEPTIVIDYPVEMSPFARRRSDDARLVERFEAFIGGVELANAFSELNDPEDQRQRFEQQRSELVAGDDEAQPFDEEFLTAMEHGMPPTGGCGIGIDRLVALLADRHSIREVILFPALKSPTGMVSKDPHGEGD